MGEGFAVQKRSFSKKKLLAGVTYVKNKIILSKTLKKFLFSQKLLLFCMQFSVIMDRFLMKALLWSTFIPSHFFNC